MPELTPFQTVGPFFDVWLRARHALPEIGPAALGTRITVVGRVLDGRDAPIPDALVEVWQADAAGRYRHPDDPRAPQADAAFIGYRWRHTADDGTFRFDTILPGAVPWPDGGEQAPHLSISVMARGVLTRYVTRMYFEGQPANAADPILARVPVERRHTLLGARTVAGPYEFEIRLQGEAETVFFDA